MLGKGDEVRENLRKVIAPCLENFSDSQAESVLDLLVRVAAVGGTPSEMQSDLIDSATGVIGEKFAPKGKWD